MTFILETIQQAVAEKEKNRVKSLQQTLKYPIIQRDPEGSRFWFLRPGKDKIEASETCPIAVGFYEQLNETTDGDIKTFLTSKPQQQEIYGHYINRYSEQQPVMYFLLPSEENSGRIALILPTEGGLRQRNIKTFTVEDPNG